MELVGFLCNIFYLYLQFYASLNHNPGLNLHVHLMCVFVCAGGHTGELMRMTMVSELLP